MPFISLTNEEIDRLALWAEEKGDEGLRLRLGSYPRLDEDAVQHAIHTARASVKAWDDEEEDKAECYEELDCLLNLSKVTTLVFRVKGGDVYEIPIGGWGPWWMMARRALEFRGLSPRDVIWCRP